MRHGWLIAWSLMGGVAGAGDQPTPNVPAPPDPSPRSTPGSAWVLPDDAYGTRVAPLLLLSRPDVRDDLKLTAEQATEAEQAIAAMQQAAAKLRGRSDSAAKIERRLVDQEQGVWLGTRLTPEQRDRLDQLDLRWEGPAALASRPAIVRELALTPEQHTALNQAITHCDGRRRTGASAIDAEQQHGTDALATLSEPQKAKWSRLLGRPFAPRFAASLGPRG